MQPGWFAPLLLSCTRKMPAGEKDLKLEVQLVLGTNEAQTNATPVSPGIEKKS